jgi:O-antigen/teichoic acid export membrane protein
MVRSLFRRVGLHSIGIIGGKIFSTGIYILLARLITPQEYGQLTFFVLLNMIMGTIWGGGLNLLYQKEVHDSDQKSLLSLLFGARFFLYILSSIVALVILFTTDLLPPSLFLIFTVNLLFESFVPIVEAYYFVAKRPLMNSLRLLLVTVSVGLTMLIYGSALKVFDLLVYYTITNGLVLLFLVPWQHINLMDTLRFEKYFQTIKRGMNYYLLQITSLLYARGDWLAIRGVLGETALGYYSMAYRYLDVLSLIPSSLTQNLFHQAAGKEGVRSHELKRITIIMTSCGALLAVLIVLFARELTVGLVGRQYESAVLPLRIFAGVLLLFFINAPLATAVQASVYVKKFLPFGAANTIANIVLNFALVPFYGIQAAAWVMLATELSGLIINGYFVRKLYQKK